MSETARPARGVAETISARDLQAWRLDARLCSAPVARTRLVELDLLRFIAIALVLGRHGEVCPAGTSRALHDVTQVWHRGGWVGVDLFFVLSGFLVSGLLFSEHKRTGRVDIRRFLLRRGFKIYPAFWVMLIATAVLVPATFRVPRITATRELGELFFLQNYVGEIWDHTWSLAVEEHFYLGLAALVALLVWKRRDKPLDLIPALFAFIAGTCLVARILTSTLTTFSYQTNLFPTHLRVDSLFFGVLLSYYWHMRDLRTSRLARRLRLGLAAGGVLLLAPPFVWSLESQHWLTTVGLSLFYLGSGLLVLSALYSELGKSRLARGLAAIGAYSYSIYLWHLPVLFWIVPELKARTGVQSWVFGAFVYYGASIVLGMILAKLIEYPVLRFRDWVLPTAARAVEPAMPVVRATRPVAAHERTRN